MLYSIVRLVIFMNYRLDIPEQEQLIVAVSGGLDSVVLLHLLNQRLPAGRLTVAHVNHGLRPEAAADARFVAGLAAAYGNRFRLLELPPSRHLSELAGRKARYAFFQQLAAEQAAAGVVTAHHADDVLETALLNLTRGTGWRGLASLRSRPGCWRPLLDQTKQQLRAYALQARLEWVEDATNQTDLYLRNRIRHRLLPSLRRQPAQLARLRALQERQLELRSAIEAELDQLPLADQLARQWLQAPDAVALECLRWFLTRHGVRQTRPQLARALAFGRRSDSGRRFSLDGQHFLCLNRDGLVVAPQKNW